MDTYSNVQGFEDTANVSKKLREGWEFVKVDQIKEEIGENKYPFYTEGNTGVYWDWRPCVGKDT